MDNEVFGMNTNQWISWISATLTAGISITIFMFFTFSTKQESKELVIRVDRLELRQDKSDERIDRKLEQINTKLDNIILNSVK